MFKFLLFLLFFYLIFRVIRRFFKGLFVITRIPDQNQTETQNPFIQRSAGREKDISDRARILEEDKNNGQNP